MATFTDDFSGGVGNFTTKRNGIASTSGAASAAVANDDCYSYCNALTPGADQYAQVQLTATVSATQAVACRQAATTNREGYYGGHDQTNGGNTRYRIWKWNGGATYNNLAEHGSESASASDVYKLTCQDESGDVRLKLYVNGVEKLSVLDNGTLGAKLTSGRVGVGVYHSATGAALIDNFEGGDLGGASGVRRRGGTSGGMQRLEGGLRS